MTTHSHRSASRHPGGGRKSAGSRPRGPAPLSVRDFFLVRRIFRGLFDARSSTASSSAANASAKPKQTHSFWNRSRCALSELVLVGSEFEYFLSGGRRGGGRSNLYRLLGRHRWRRRAHLCASIRELFFSASPPPMLGITSGINPHSLRRCSRTSPPSQKIAAKFRVGGSTPAGELS